MSEKTYNGWTNYETWNVKLWMDNEEGSYRAGLEMAREAWKEAEAPSANARLTGHEPFTRLERARINLARRLKDEYEEANPLNEQPSVWSDLLSAALSEVNWDEIASAMLEEVDTTEEPEEVEAE